MNGLVLPLSFPARRSSDLAPYQAPAGAWALATATEKAPAGVGAAETASDLAAASATAGAGATVEAPVGETVTAVVMAVAGAAARDRKSTRLNSSHVKISYA